jgi:nicotinamide riboside kinase
MCKEFQSEEEIFEYRDMILNRVEDYTHLLYIPIQYPVISDGFRFANEIFRHKIDYELKNFLYKHDIEYYTLSGKSEMRLKQITNILEEE